MFINKPEPDGAGGNWACCLVQGVSVRDGLADDGAVIRVCKDFLKARQCSTSPTDSSVLPEAASNATARKPHCRRPWGLCVLRAYQRLCCRALRAPTDRLYAFKHRPRKFLAAEAQLRKRFEGEKQESPTCIGSAAPGNAQDSPSIRDALEDLEDDIYCGNCLVRCGARRVDLELLVEKPRP